MRSLPALILTAVIAFTIGAISCASGLWLLRNYLAKAAPRVQVSGVLKFQAEPSDPSASANPPNGYFVESTATGRVYLENAAVSRYVGRKIVSSGRVSAVCGNDGTPCYPEIVATSIREAK